MKGAHQALALLACARDKLKDWRQISRALGFLMIDSLEMRAPMGCSLLRVPESHSMGSLILASGMQLAAVG